jgi:hypothetical protein
MAYEIVGSEDRFSAMLALSGSASEEVREKAIAETLAVARSIEDNAAALAQAAALLPAAQRQVVLAEAADAAVRTVERVDEALRRWHSPYLHLPVGMLAVAASYLPDPARSDLTARVLRECDRLPDTMGKHAIHALAVVAGYSPPDTRRRLLTRALVLARQETYVDALVWLAPHLDEPDRGEALNEAIKIIGAGRSWSSWSDVAAALRSRSPEEVYGLVKHSPDGLRARPREHLAKEITALAPVVFDALPPVAAEDVRRALNDVGRWWP